MKLRYVELHSNRIFNWLGPFNVIARGVCKQRPDLLNTWWSDETIQLRKTIAEVWVEEFDNITKHFSRLEESIKEHGILSPISLVSGPPRDQYLKNIKNSLDGFPPAAGADTKQILYNQPFGGSRIMVAQKLNIKNIPCVVHDFSDLFPEAEEVTRKNYSTWFNTEQYSFINSAPHIRLIKHSHIDGIYGGINHKTRNAQKEAIKITREKLGI